MATGETTTGTLSDALPEIVADARIVKEFDGTWQRTCEVHKQTPNTGLSWTEFALNRQDSQDITETTDNQNFQQYVGSLLSSEPQMTQIITKVTDRTYRKIAAVVKSKMGTLAGNAMSRKKDKDYLALFSTFATTASPGTGQPFGSGYIAAAKNNVTSNVTEPSMAQVFTIVHGFQLYDLQTEITAPVGTYTIGDLSAQFFQHGFQGTVSSSHVFEDGNITVDATPDARGATHAKEGVIAVMGMAIKTEKDRDIHFGGGADVISMVDEYSFVERKSGTSGTTQVWCYAHLSDATAPTS